MQITMHPYFWLISKIAIDNFGEAGVALRTAFKILDKIEAQIPAGAEVANPLYRGPKVDVPPSPDVTLDLMDTERAYLKAALTAMSGKIKPAEGRPVLAALDILEK